MAREFLMIVEESAFLTPVTTPTIWTTSTTYGLANYQGAYVRLDGGNAFTMRDRPVGAVTVPYGGGVAIDAYMVHDKEECVGQLTCKLTIGLAPLLLSWAGVRIAGGTSPWTTTIPNGDLASCTVYHAVTRGDGTIKRNAYTGVKVSSFGIVTGEDATDVTLTLNLVASACQGNSFDSSTDPSAGTFPAPADNNFATDAFVYTHTGGANYFTFGGAVRTQFSEVNIQVQNKLARKWYANHYAQLIQFVGRKTTLASKILYPPSAQDDRTNFVNMASEACSIKFNNGTHGFVMNLNAQNVFTPFEDDLPLEGIYMQSSTENNMWDPSAGSDFTLTFT